MKPQPMNVQCETRQFANSLPLLVDIDVCSEYINVNFVTLVACRMLTAALASPQAVHQRTRTCIRLEPTGACQLLQAR